MTPLTRYKEDDVQYHPVKPKGIIAKTIGHQQGVEFALITILQNLEISAGHPKDDGWLSKEIIEMMEGNEVYYYVAKEKKEEKTKNNNSKKLVK
jgi:hypothetical protein